MDTKIEHQVDSGLVVRLAMLVQRQKEESEALASPTQWIECQPLDRRSQVQF